MTNVRVKFKYGAKFQLRNSPEVKQFLEAAGTILRDDANKTLAEGGAAREGSPRPGGYRMSSSRGINYPFGHWRVQVYTSSNHAKRSNAKHNTLLRLLKAQ